LRPFIYLPLSHSEDLGDQERAVELVRKFDETYVPRAEGHRNIIKRFGRFPHRNPILGRTMTAEEQDFLDQGGLAGQRIYSEPSPEQRDLDTMTTISDHRVRAKAVAPAQYFYFNMALACMAVAFLGFAPTYWLPLAHRTFSAPPVVHFHGVLFFTW